MTDTPRFELYSYWRTSATYRVRVALNIKGIAAQEYNVNLDLGGQRDPTFLKINPLGAIPALIDRAASAAAPGEPAEALTQSLACWPPTPIL